jgi:hypothetical protein
LTELALKIQLLSLSKAGFEWEWAQVAGNVITFFGFVLTCVTGIAQDLTENCSYTSAGKRKTRVFYSIRSEMMRSNWMAYLMKQHGLK